MNSGSTSSDIVNCYRKIPLSAKTGKHHFPNDNVGNKAELLPESHPSLNKDVTQHAQFYLKVLKDNGILAPSAQLQGVQYIGLIKSTIRGRTLL